MLTPESELHMQKPRRKVTASFIAKYDNGECPVCFRTMEAGERLRYNPEGELVHHQHDRQEVTPAVCDTCWLTKPCECDE